MAIASIRKQSVCIGSDVMSCGGAGRKVAHYNMLITPGCDRGCMWACLRFYESLKMGQTLGLDCGLSFSPRVEIFRYSCSG